MNQDDVREILESVQEALKVPQPDRVSTLPSPLAPDQPAAPQAKPDAKEEALAAISLPSLRRDDPARDLPVTKRDDPARDLPSSPKSEMGVETARSIPTPSPSLMERREPRESPASKGDDLSKSMSDLKAAVEELTKVMRQRQQQQATQQQPSGRTFGWKNQNAIGEESMPGPPMMSGSDFDGVEERAGKSFLRS